ncbi:MAG: PhoX family phosphatase [Gammaproteobacteria bacterium]|nr:PhoX family phosphatase [Gammaproteobacteria bacterium]
MRRQGRSALDHDDLPVSPDTNPTFEEVIKLRLSRRQALQTLGAGAAVVAALPWTQTRATAGEATGPSSLRFAEVSHGRDETLHVPPGYHAQVVLRWGDPLFPASPDFDPARQSAASQRLQFGYNNDYVVYLPIPRGESRSDHGVLAVNHEYTIGSLMFPDSPAQFASSKKHVAVEIMAHGMSIAEVRRTPRGWHIMIDSGLNRRITPLTELRMSGPAAGHPRLRTPYSKDGVLTWGTYANCAGGVTPWGTVLTAEENIQFYFEGSIDAAPEVENYRRLGLGTPGVPAFFRWHRHYRRWNLQSNPNEPLHVGWIVEVDPYDPLSKPVKRTALGRCKHEGCNVFINRDGRIVCYMGDDQHYEYVYRFVTQRRYDPKDRLANVDLLDEGVLSVAEFNATGKIIWHPLIYGQGPLTERNGFRSQGDVVIDLRKAADLVGATRMDRPEGIGVNPVTNSVFVLLTENSYRAHHDAHPANPRGWNISGHILELTPPEGDHAAPEFNWELFLLAGNPANPDHRARYHGLTTEHGWLVNPDNCTFDRQGRLWITTDNGVRHQYADGVWACDVFGPGRALTRHFLRAPVGAEVCGPCFTPDDTTFFCAIQHPAEGTSFRNPATRWPDFRLDHPPRPAVVAVTKNDGGVIGT